MNIITVNWLMDDFGPASVTVLRLPLGCRGVVAIDDTDVLPGANIAVTESAETTLHKRGVLCVPDFLANAGGVICAWIEHRGGDKAQAMSTIDDRIRANTAELVDRMRLSGDAPRHAAETMAWQRLKSARRLRRGF